MDIGTSITYVFRDKNWLTKLAIGAAILLVSIPADADPGRVCRHRTGAGLQSGCAAQCAGRRQPLPESRDRWGEWMVSGLKYLLLLLIWSLPA